MSRNFLAYSLGAARTAGTAGLLAFLASTGALAGQPTVSVVWKATAGEQPLQSWSVKELAKEFKKASGREKDLRGELARWDGVSLQNVIEKALHTLPLETRAQADLVVLKSENGQQALLPRWVVTRYPVVLALSKNGQTLKGAQVVVPWTSKSKLRDESLPLETYFLSDVSRIELASYGDQYGHLLLKRRTDPSAMRGEKLFVQSCMGCHAAGRGAANVARSPNDARMRTLASSSHPSIQGLPHLTERDHRALASYLEAYRTENPVGVSKAQLESPDAAAAAVR